MPTMVGADYRCQKEQQCDDCQRTQQRSEYYGDVATCTCHRAAGYEHDNCHTQGCSVGNAEDGRACQGIAEGRLEHQSRSCQRGSAENGSDGLGQTRLKHYVAPRLLFRLASGYDRPYLRKGYAHRSKEQVASKEQQQEKDDG